MIKKCVLCDGKLVKKVVAYSTYGIELGRFPAMVCVKCKEQWFDELTARKIEKIEKEKGIFGLSKESKISYSGNSLIIRIPKKISEAMHLKKEGPVLIYPVGKNKLEIEIQ
ncbi:MAG: hypothetical protein ACPLXC_01025 [Candidatus Pacearchaeota archaeon]